MPPHPNTHIKIKTNTAAAASGSLAPYRRRLQKPYHRHVVIDFIRYGPCCSTLVSILAAAHA
jgi:hypothetical protein